MVLRRKERSVPPKQLIALGACLLWLPLSLGAETITAKGSDTLVILAQRWAEVYMRERPEIRIQVTGGGSGTGLAALQNQTTDLAYASRRIKPREVAACIKAFGAKPREYRVCLDGLSIYVHDENPVKELSIAQLAAIFTGQMTHWREVGGADAPITIYSRENSSGTYEFFKNTILAGEDFDASTQTMQGTAAVLQALAKDESGIGYGGAAYGVKAGFVRVRQNETTASYFPTEENILSHRYPIWRPLYIYVNPKQDKGSIRDYLTWIRSPKGQAIVREVGYFPLPTEGRS